MAHERGVQSLIWSNEGTRLISTGNEGRVISWSLDDLQASGRMEFSFNTAPGFCQVPNSTSILFRLSRYNLSLLDWKERRRADVSNQFQSFDLAISPDKEWIATGLYHRADPDGALDDGISFSRYLSVFPDLFDEQSRFNWSPKGELQNLRFAPDSKAVAVSRWFRATGQDVEDHAVWLVPVPQIEDDSTDPSIKDLPLEHAERIPVLFASDSAFSPDGRQLSLITRSSLVQWNIAERRIQWEIPRTTIHSVAYSPDGSLIAIGGHDRIVVVVNAADGVTRFSFATHRAHIRSMTFSPDGRLLASSSSDGAIKLWHLPSGQEMAEFPNPGQDMLKIEFTADGNFLICQTKLPGNEGITQLKIIDGSKSTSELKDSE